MRTCQTMMLVGKNFEHGDPCLDIPTPFILQGQSDTAV
jgi:hypothetical protein